MANDDNNSIILFIIAGIMIIMAFTGNIKTNNPFDAVIKEFTITGRSAIPSEPVTSCCKLEADNYPDFKAYLPLTALNADMCQGTVDISQDVPGFEGNITATLLSGIEPCTARNCDNNNDCYTFFHSCYYTCQNYSLADQSKYLFAQEPTTSHNVCLLNNFSSVQDMLAREVYPNCIDECYVDSDCKGKIVPVDNDCSVFWSPKNITLTQKCVQNSCEVNTSHQATTCTDNQLRLQQYKWYIIGAGALIIIASFIMYVKRKK